MEFRVGFFLMAIISSCQSFVTANAPFTSRKSSAETISQYAIVRLIVSSAGKLYQGHSLDLTVFLEIDRVTSFEIQLSLNQKLLPPTFKTAHYDDKGDMVYGTHQNCFYQGTVVGHPKWMAEFSTCSGLRGSFGDLQDRQFYYHLEPLGESDTFNQPHALYMDSEHKVRKHGTCGTLMYDHTTSNQPEAEQLILHKLDISPNRLMKRQNSNGLRIMEWLIVNDYDKYSVTYNSNRTATELRSIEIANTVNMLYSPLSIRVVLVHMITITSAANRFQESSALSLLPAFRTYHKYSIPSTIQHDSAMLMTGINLDGDIFGISFSGTMCSGSNSIGLIMDTGGNLASVSDAAAHELGHIFNMQHDDIDPTRVCSCDGDQPRCIMAGSLSIPAATRFSNCSVADLNKGYSTMNTGVCLNNDPSVIIGTATCGNGIKEPGEICDCGPAQTCNDPCCNATSCELRSIAQCRTGACCNNCQFKAYGTICRPDSNECGLSEYCTGDNAECPSDVFHQDGQPCANNTEYCLSGKCIISHDLQCKQYYGPSSATAQPICYMTNNAIGQVQGHCGASNDQFIPCSQANVLCGSIQCNGGNFNQSAVISRTPLRLNTTFVGPNQDQCNTFTTFSTSDEISPGLVLNGTRCGNEMLCMNHRCVPVSNLSTSPCPVGSNAAVCSANGVCNNLNQCFCNIGFTGLSCSVGPDTTPSPVTEESEPTVIGEILIPVVVSISVVVTLFILSSVVIFTTCYLLVRKHKLRATPQDMISMESNTAYGQAKGIEMQENHAYSVVSVPDVNYESIVEVKGTGIHNNSDVDNNSDVEHYYI